MKTDGQTQEVPEQVKPEKSKEDQLLDEMLGVSVHKEEQAQSNPQAAKMEKFPLSEPTYEKPERVAEGTVKKQERPSVRKELREIQSRRRQEEAMANSAKARESSHSSKTMKKSVQHKQPSKKKKKLKMKER